MPFHKLRDKVVRPQDLCFTQDSISVTFKRPRDQERIDYAVDRIIRGKLSPKAFPKMNVVEFQHRLWSLDNRRLWVFKKAAVNLITVTLVAFDFGNGFHSLVSTSPYLYSTLSSPDFFPRIRGFCKEIFSNGDEPGMPFSVPIPPPHPSPPPRQALPCKTPTKIYRNSAPPADRFCVPRPYKPPKQPKSPPPSKMPNLPSTSKHVAYAHVSNKKDYRSPSQFKNLDEYRRHGPSEAPRVRSLAVPPPPSKQLGSEHGHSLPKPKKRPYNSTERPHSKVASTLCSAPPAENCRSPPQLPMREQRRACPPRPSRTPREEFFAHPPAKKLKIHDRGRESRTFSPAPSLSVPSPPLQKSKCSPRLAGGVRAPASPRRANTPTSPTIIPRRVTRSLERPVDLAANRLSCQSTDSNVLSSDKPRFREKHPVKCFPPTPPLAKDRNPPRGREASSTSRAAPRAAPKPPLAQPAMKKSRPSKPMSNAKNFSYDFHSCRKRSKAPKGSKKADTSPATKPPSTPFNDRSVLPSSAVASSESSPTSSLPEPHPALSTSGREVGKHYTPDLPSPPVAPPKCPPLTRRPALEKLGQQSDPSRSDGLSIHHSIFGTSPTETRPESAGLVDFATEGEILTQTKVNQRTSDAEPGFKSAGNELSPQDRLTLDAIVSLFLRDTTTPPVPAQTNRTEGTPENELTEAEIRADQLPPAQMPIDVGDFKYQRDELQDMSGRSEIYQAVFHYDAKGQFHESTEVHGVRNLHRAAANMDVTDLSAAGSDPLELQASTPATRGREVRKTSTGTRVATPSDRKAHPAFGNEVLEVSQRITRSQIKKQKDTERQREREKRKEARRVERASKATKERQGQSFSKERSEGAPVNMTTEIVPYQSKIKKGVSGMITVDSGDMVYVKVSGEIGSTDTQWRRNSKSKIRLHPYLRIIGPFKVERMFSAYAAVLELPDDCDLKPIFSLKLLLKSKSPLVSNFPETRLAIKLVPETVLKKRVARRLKKRKVLHYLVKWETLPATEATWEPETIFDEYPHLLDQIESPLPLLSNPYLFRNWRA